MNVLQGLGIWSIVIAFMFGVTKDQSYTDGKICIVFTAISFILFIIGGLI